MDKIKTLLLSFFIIIAGSINAQNHNPKLPPVGNDNALTDYSSSKKGFWCAVQLGSGYSLLLKNANAPFTELDVVGGYRFSQFFKVGLGFGGRYYFLNSNIRETSIKWSMPIYLNIRGNFIDDTYRTVVPYYSTDLGATIRDGFMLRPTVGIRIGQERSAFSLGLTYMGQNLKFKTGKDRYVSFLGLTLGYEY